MTLDTFLQLTGVVIAFTTLITGTRYLLKKYQTQKVRGKSFAIQSGESTSIVINHEKPETKN